MLHTHHGKSDAFRSDPRLVQLSLELRRLAVDYVSAPEPHGPPCVLVRGTFPMTRYLEHLFRTGALTAEGNAPGDPKAYKLSRADWAGLEIAVGGNAWRLGVWRIGKVITAGEGVLRTLRVERETVLSVFPRCCCDTTRDQHGARNCRTLFAMAGCFEREADEADKADRSRRCAYTTLSKRTSIVKQR